MFYWNGYTKEIKFADGNLAIVGTFNPLALDKEQRQLVFTLVDTIDTFHKSRLTDTTGKPRHSETLVGEGTPPF